MENNLYIENDNENLNALIAVYDSIVNYHIIDENGVGAAQPLSMTTAKEVFNFLNDIEIIAKKYSFKNEIIQDKVLAYSTEKKEIVWWTPASSKKLLFKEDLPIKSGNYPVPILLWKQTDNQLSIWALDNQPIKANQAIYNAPFLNVNGFGQVCMGNAKFNTNSNYYEEIIKKTETAFFNSYFTHTNHNNIVNGNYNDIINDLHSLISLSKAKLQFPSDLLVKTKLTLKDIINGN